MSKIGFVAHRFIVYRYSHSHSIEPCRTELFKSECVRSFRSQFPWAIDCVVRLFLIHSLSIHFRNYTKISCNSSDICKPNAQLCICLHSSSCIFANICWWHFVVPAGMVVCLVPSVHLQFSNKRNFHFHATQSFRAPKTNTFFFAHFFSFLFCLFCHTVPNANLFFLWCHNQKDAQIKHMLFAVLRVQHRKCNFSHYVATSSC